MVDILRQFESAFSCDEFSHALFYEFEYGLRFELGGEDIPITRPIKRLIKAYERANTIASELFENSNTLWLLSSCYGSDAPKKKRLKPYKTCGIPPRSFKYLGALPQEDNYDDSQSQTMLNRHWDAVELTDRDCLSEILWLTLGSELGIRPTINAGIYIVDFERATVLHPYDDRGLDVVSARKEHLLELYETRKPWLLDYDIARMEAVFSQTD